MAFKDFLLAELIEAYHKARIGGKRKTKNEHNFELNELENITNLRDTIIARAYKPHRGVAFIVEDPVRREIFAASFSDRIVHHFLYKYTSEWWEPRFWKGSYSCRKEKGTLYGAKDLQKHMCYVAKTTGEQAIIIKRDIRGYFMSLNHQKLYQRIIWGLNQQFPSGGELYKILKYLWKITIFDDPKENVIIRGKRTDWNELPPDKSLFTQPKGRGLVIGNLTSQLASNIYLDQLDRYIVHTLKYKHYGRYVDDFYIVVPKSKLKTVLKDMTKVETYLKFINLTLHPKKKTETPAKYGVEFLGYKVYPDYILPSKRLRRNFAKTVYKLATTGHGKLESISSYDGHFSHINSHKYIKKIYGSVGWDYPYPKLKKGGPRGKSKGRNP